MAEASEVKSGSKLGKLKSLLGYVFVLLNLSAMGAGSYLVYASTIGFKYKMVTEEMAMKDLEHERVFEKDEPIIYTMDPFIINLEGFPRRVIRMTVNLEMLDEEGFENLIEMGPRSRDLIVKILNSKSFQDLEPIQGKLMLKDEILLSLNQSLPSGVIRDVYFSDFVVQ